MHGVKLKLCLLCVGCKARFHDKAYVSWCVHRGTICTRVSLGTCVSMCLC